MDLVVCHTTVDFDALGAAVGVARLRPGCKIVLAGGAHPAVRDFLALHRDEYPLLERRSVDPAAIRSLTVVDTQQRDRLGPLAAWLDLPHLDTLALYDHHPDGVSDIPATQRQVEPVGATTTLVVEALQRAIATGAEALTCNPLVLPTACLSPAEATVMALGIHVDTGSLTYEGTTARDAAALAWLMGQGASVRAIAAYVDPALSPDLQPLLAQCLKTVEIRTIHHYQVAWVSLDLPDYVPGLSTLAGRLIDTIGSDALLFGARYGDAQDRAQDQDGSAQDQDGSAQEGAQDQDGDAQDQDGSDHLPPGLPAHTSDRKTRLVIIGRSRIPHTDLSGWFSDRGGGGHARAAAVTLHQGHLPSVLAELLDDFAAQIPQPPIARDLMSSPVRTIRPETTIDEARRILLRYGHSGLSVVDDHGELVGIVSRRDLDIALHHGFGHAPVKGYMSTRLQTIAPDTPLAEIETRMVTYDIGRLPVIAAGKLVGIVTRTDVLRQFQRDRPDPLRDTFETAGLLPSPSATPSRPDRRVPIAIPLQRFAPPLRRFLDQAAALAQERGWHLYVVGGAVRDALLGDRRSPLMLTDLDLVVDACQGRPVTEGNGAAVELGTALQTHYPDARLQVHGRFQTAALLWHNDPELGSLWADIATARTEFYPYPAANPEVEASSIRQDLYRRDFTINALAVRLTQPRPGELLDFFGGLIDLKQQHIRVLHANSFIEDPTRIYRAVRFAVRLGFALEPQTETYIRYAIAHLPFTRSQPAATRLPALETRLKAELKIILQAPSWSGAIALLDHLDALRCIHPHLQMTRELWHQLRLMARGWHVLGHLQPARPGPELTLWECLLETLLAALDPGDRAAVATRLQLTDTSIQRLATLAQTETALTVALAQCDRPSQLVDCLHGYDTGTLVLVAVRQGQSPLGRSQRRHIWHYLVDLSQRRSLLDGRALQTLGYRPGPQFKTILSDLRRATLDGDIGDHEAAIAYLRHHHPLPTPPHPQP